MVNEQDFDVFAHRLSTIPEMDDEQKDNSVLAGFSRHWTQLKRLSTKGRMSGFLSTEQTSEISSLSFTSVDFLIFFG